MKAWREYFSQEVESDQRLILSVLGTTLVATLLLFSLQISRELIFFLISGLAIAFGLAMRGNLKIAGWIGPMSALAVLTALAFRNFGIRDTAMLGLPIIIVSASLMNGQRGTLISGLACLLVVISLWLAEQTQWSTREFSGANELADYLVLLVLIMLTTALQWAVIRRLNDKNKKVSRELAERQRAEQALRESEERYRAMVETFPDVIMLTDLRGEIVFVNAALEKQTGYSLAELNSLKGKDKNFIHHQDVENIRAAIRELLESDKPCTDLIENRFIDKAGETHWYSGIISKAHYQGQVVLQTVTREITARKQAEELTTQVNFELQRRLKELHVLNAVAQAGAAAKSEDEMLETVVETLHRSLYPEIVGIAFWDEESGLLRTHPNAHRGLPASINQTTVRPGQGILGQVAATRRPYRLKDIHDPLYIALDPQVCAEVCVPILAGDKLIGVLSVESRQPQAFGDSDENLLVTIAGQLAAGLDRLHAEQELRSLNADLEQRVLERTRMFEAANKELEAFSYSVSHDLRAPLRAINSFAHILQDDFGESLDPMAHNYLRKIMAAGKKMSLLIDDLLQFSRLGRQALQKQPVDLNALVHTAIDPLMSEIAGRRIDWILAKLPGAAADPALLQQVFTNLISNAVKYTGRRAVAQIEVGSLQRGAELVYFVRDNGAGFDMRYADKLFGVFQRLHRDEDFEGTGIGLAIVERIIQRHGGRIWAEAQVEHGATFYFTLG